MSCTHTHTHSRTGNVNNWCLFVCYGSFLPSFAIHHTPQSSAPTDSFEDSRFSTLCLFSPFSLKVTPLFGAQSTTHFPPLGAALSNLLWDFFFLLSHLWITPSGGFFIELELWQNMNHSCNNSCVCVSGAVSRHVQPLVRAGAFCLNSHNEEAKTMADLSHCFTTCSFLTFIFVLNRTMQPRVCRSPCAGAEVHDVADWDPGSVVQPPEAHNEQNQRARGGLRASNIDVPAKKV